MQPSDALTDHFLRTASVGAVYADMNGTIGADDAVQVYCPAGRVILCCVRGKQHEVADLARTMVSARNDHPAAVSAIHKAAAERLIGLTPYSTVIARALVAVAKVEQTMADMQKSGALKAMNREFKAAREAGLATSYSAFVHAKKLALLEAMAAGRR
jgi:hypothetical protein